MKKRKILSVILCMIMTIPTLTACSLDEFLDRTFLGGGGYGGGDNSFTYMLSAMEPTSFYNYYQNNPAVQYLTSKTYEGKDGEQRNISLYFTVPPAGKGSETLNNMITANSEPDLFDIALYAGSIGELYATGRLLDLKPYIDAYMPNYNAYLDANPELKKYVTTTVNGEEKYITLPNVRQLDYNSQKWGWCYRRDWIVNYGKDKNGQGFSGEFTQKNDGSEAHDKTLLADTNGDSWVDNVVFPSYYQKDTTMKWYADLYPDWNGNDPVTISDWEWMFGIFADILKENGIKSAKDGYPFTMFYPGYIRNGDLVCSFGGGGPFTYIKNNADGTTEAAFGGTSNEFKVYLECLHTWYDKGWLDKGFADNTDDQYFAIDDNLVRSGKVGLWQGLFSTMGTRIRKDKEAMTSGAIVYGARQPINDVYGSQNEKYKIPYTMWAGEVMGNGICISSKAANKDLRLLFTFLDYMYGEEGARIKTIGLSKEQLEESSGSVKDFYKKYGLENGAYFEVEKEGKTYYQQYSNLENASGDLQAAVAANRMIGLSANAERGYGYGKSYIHSMQEWTYYENKGFMGGLALSKAEVADLKRYSEIETDVEVNFMYIYVPQFITGGKSLSKDWTWYRGELNRRNAQGMVDILNKYL